MDLVAAGQAGLSGWKGKLADRVAAPVASRTGMSEEQIQALIGALFLALAVYQLTRKVRTVLRAGRAA